MTVLFRQPRPPKTHQVLYSNLARCLEMNRDKEHMTYPVEGGLNQHRQNLINNDKCFTQDKERALKNWVNHSWTYVKQHSPLAKKQAAPVLFEMAELVWKSQGGLPLFQYTSPKGLPMAWNRPQSGDLDYIRYEVGHISPILSGGSSHPENLSFQSARCNQHIQSSLDFDEVMTYFFGNEEVLNRVNSLQQLHKSEEWAALISLLQLS